MTLVQSSKRRLTRRLFDLGAIAGALLLALGCKKDEPPPPLPSATPAATPAAPLQLVPEEPIVDAGADTGAKKPTGKGAPRASMANCCAALASNAKLAPPPNNAYLEQAAALCSSLAGMGKDQPAIMGAIQGALKGAQLPTACK